MQNILMQRMQVLCEESIKNFHLLSPLLCIFSQNSFLKKHNTWYGSYTPYM